jgi:hypothetical protein
MCAGYINVSLFLIFEVAWRLHFDGSFSKFGSFARRIKRAKSEVFNLLHHQMLRCIEPFI